MNDSTQAIATSTNLVLYLTEPRMGLCMEVAAFFATTENGTVRVSRIRHPSPVVMVFLSAYSACGFVSCRLMVVSAPPIRGSIWKGLHDRGTDRYVQGL